jgi:hypothetical protein
MQNGKLTRLPLAWNANRGRVNTVDLLIKLTCFVTKVDNIFNKNQLVQTSYFVLLGLNEADTLKSSSILLY